jgi:hypothetical protein
LTATQLGLATILSQSGSTRLGCSQKDSLRSRRGVGGNASILLPFKAVCVCKPRRSQRRGFSLRARAASIETFISKFGRLTGKREMKSGGQPQKARFLFPQTGEGKSLNQPATPSKSQ